MSGSKRIRIPCPPLTRPFLAKLRPAAVALAHGIEGGIGAIHFHLMHDLQQLAQLAFGETLLRKPREIFHGQIMDGHAALT